MNLTCNPELDIIFVPFSPISETDKFEVRVQIMNSGDESEIDIEIYLDEASESNLSWRGKAFAQKGRYAFAQCFPNIIGKSGQHKIMVRFSKDGKNRQTVSKEFEVRTHAQNLIEGSFIMFGPPAGRKPCSPFYNVRELTDEQWKEQIDSFNELGFKMIVPMATVQLETVLNFNDSDGDKLMKAHYPSKIYPKSGIKAHDPVKAIFETAEKNGQKILLPFGCNYRICKHRLEIMRELWGRYGHYKSFYGWYQPYEVPFHLSGELFATFLKLLEEDKKLINEISPAKPLMVSVLCGQDAINDAVSMMLSNGMCKADIITPMDMVGMTGRPEQLKINSRTFSVLRDALKTTAIHLWGNCESFDLTPTPIIPRYKNGGFDGKSGFIQQIETLRPYSEKLVTFMATGMFAKPGLEPVIGGEKAAEQYRRYKDYMQKPRPVYKNIARGHPYTKSQIPDFPDNTLRLLIDPNRYGYIPDENNSSTDGYIAGGRYGGRYVDASKIYGYILNESKKSIDIEVLFDFEAPQPIDMIRVSESPLSPHAGLGTNDPDASPDYVSVETGNTLNGMTEHGRLDAFVNGWAKILFPSTAKKRFVKLIFHKEIKANYPDGSLLLINEIEICKKYQ